MKHICLILIASSLFMFGKAQTPGVSLSITGGIDNQHLKGRIESNTSQLLTAINSAYTQRTDISVSTEIITIEALTFLQELWEEVNFYCFTNHISENLLRGSGSYQIRNVPIVIRTDKQNAVISYNLDGIIDDFYFGLEVHQYQNVMSPNSVIDKTRREIILNFIENFRTAYIRKDLDFIEKIFSDHALIITGKVVKQQDLNTDNLNRNLTPRQIEYQVHTKSEYIERLSKVFDNISHLILEFNDIEVNIHRKYPNFYGVLLEQYWASPNYQDTGYLFLLVQFRDNDHPLIWIRTWQDATEVERDEIFGFHNFRITEGSVQ
jgi:hypothetical protein